jgi:hypothetical protein
VKVAATVTVTMPQEGSTGTLESEGPAGGRATFGLMIKDIEGKLRNVMVMRQCFTRGILVVDALLPAPAIRPG